MSAVMPFKIVNPEKRIAALETILNILTPRELGVGILSRLCKMFDCFFRLFSYFTDINREKIYKLGAQFLTLALERYEKITPNALTSDVRKCLWDNCSFFIRKNSQYSDFSHVSHSHTLLHFLQKYYDSFSRLMPERTYTSVLKCTRHILAHRGYDDGYYRSQVWGNLDQAIQDGTHVSFLVAVLHASYKERRPIPYDLFDRLHSELDRQQSYYVLSARDMARTIQGYNYNVKASENRRDALDPVCLADNELFANLFTGFIHDDVLRNATFSDCRRVICTADYGWLIPDEYYDRILRRISVCIDEGDFDFVNCALILSVAADWQWHIGDDNACYYKIYRACSEFLTTTSPTEGLRRYAGAFLHSAAELNLPVHHSKPYLEWYEAMGPEYFAQSFGHDQAKKLSEEDSFHCDVEVEDKKISYRFSQYWKYYLHYFKRSPDEVWQKYCRESSGSSALEGTYMTDGFLRLGFKWDVDCYVYTRDDGSYVELRRDVSVGVYQLDFELRYFTESGNLARLVNFEVDGLRYHKTDSRARKFHIQREGYVIVRCTDADLDQQKNLDTFLSERLSL